MRTTFSSPNLQSILPNKDRLVGNEGPFPPLKHPSPIRFGSQSNDAFSPNKTDLSRWIESKESFEKRLHTLKHPSIPKELGKVALSFAKYPFNVLYQAYRLPIDVVSDQKFGLLHLHPLYVLMRIVHANELSDQHKREARDLAYSKLLHDDASKFMRVGLFEKALKQFEIALKKYPEKTVDTYGELAEFCADATAVTVGKGRHGNPDYDRFGLLGNQRIQKRLRESNIPFEALTLEAYERSQQLSPKSNHPLWKLARFHEYLGNMDKAIAYQEKSVEACKADPKSQHMVATSIGMLAHTLRDAGQLDRALELQKKLWIEDETLNLHWRGIQQSIELDGLLSLYKLKAEQDPQIIDKKTHALNKTIETLQEIIRAHPIQRLERQYADFCYHYGRPELARPLYQKYFDAEMQKRQPDGRDLKLYTTRLNPAANDPNMIPPATF